MQADAPGALPSFPFWDYSLRVYGRAGVAEAALALQDDAGLDVNLLLLCLWSAEEGPGRLSPAVLARCMSAAAAWQTRVVQPLRALRRELGKGELRQRLTAAELAAEHEEQQRLAAILEALDQRRVPGEGRADATANLAAYCELAGVALDGPTRDRLAVLLAALTPA